MKKFFSKVLNAGFAKFTLFSIIAIIVFSIICALLMMSVYLIPTQGLVHKNIEKSAQLLQYETDFQPVSGAPQNEVGGITLDNYTESTMLLEAGMHKIDGPVKDAMKNYFNLDPDKLQKETLQNIYLDGADQTQNIQSYSRYWHGYLI